MSLIGKLSTPAKRELIQLDEPFEQAKKKREGKIKKQKKKKVRTTNQKPRHMHISQSVEFFCFVFYLTLNLITGCSINLLPKVYRTKKYRNNKNKKRRNK
jgi:hypothetical protein